MRFWHTGVGMALCLALSGCALLPWDRSEVVASAIVFDADGQINQPAFNAAIKARFPLGSPWADFEAFVRSAKGSCRPSEEGERSCTLPVRGGLCWSESILFEVKVDSGTIAALKYYIGGLSC